METKMLKILLVDDHPNFRYIFRMKLSQLPFVIVEEAATGREALEKTDAFLPHLIFMDIVLPDANGLQLTREIKAKYPSIGIAIITSHGLPEYRDLAIQSGADRFFIKISLDWDEVREFVQSVPARESGDPV
jgi:DNA-binding NarL/FixJ family response regulator